MKDGYITLTIGGKERSLKFNMRAMEELSAMKCASDMGLTSSAMIVYAGLIGWYFVKQRTPDFTFEEVADWVEELTLAEDMEGLKLVNECFAASRAFNFVTEKAKKKMDRPDVSDGKTSMPSPGEQSDLSPESITN